MSKENSRYRWFVVVVFFFFMLLHQTDKLMIGSLQVHDHEDICNQQRRMGIDQLGRFDCCHDSISDLGISL